MTTTSTAAESLKASDRQLNLAVMEVCRQVYEESHHIMWTSNAFCFYEAYSLSAFVTCLNFAQRRKINNLHLLAGVAGTDKFADNKRAIPLKIVDSLPNVKSLYLEICRGDEYGGYEGYEDEAYYAVTGLFHLLRELKKLPLQDVEVRCRDGSIGAFHECEGKIKLLSDFRSQLLDPQGAKQVQKTRQSTRPAAKLWSEEEALDDLEKTRQFAGQVIEKAKAIQYRASVAQDKLSEFEAVMQHSRMWESTKEKKLSYLQANARSYAFKAEQAAIRIEKWEETIRKKEALTERRLAKLEKAEANEEELDESAVDFEDGED